MVYQAFQLVSKVLVTWQEIARKPPLAILQPLGAIAENSQSIGSEYKKDENYYSKVETINWYLTDDKEKYQKDKNKKEAGKFIDKKAYWNHEN